MGLTNTKKKYVAKLTGRKWNTKEEAIEDNKRYRTNVHYRYHIKSSNYKSPYIDYKIPFIPEKKIKLTNAGLATGATLSTNMLDSIADNAKRAGLSLKTALGLAVKESTLGNPTFDLVSRAKISNVDKSELNRAKLYNPKAVIKPKQNIGANETGIYGSKLINYNSDDNPYNSATMYIFRKAKTYEDNIRMLEETEAYADRLSAKNQSLPHKSYLQVGFEKYKNDPYSYNPGQDNYPQLVEQRANEVWNSPEIQTWYKRRLESAGKKSK
jgi:hypothetical protein